MSQYTLLTQQGYETLKAQVEELRTTGRREASAAIAEAREKGASQNLWTYIPSRKTRFFPLN